MVAMSYCGSTTRCAGSGWAIFVEASRFAARGYPQSWFPDPVSRLVERERAAQSEEEEAHFENAYYLTFVFLPPPEEAARVGLPLRGPGGRVGC
jgi:type IV secretion system protein TrbE